MTFGAKESTQSTQSNQALSPQVMTDLQSNLDNAQALQSSYTPYTGQLVAPVSAATTQAQQGILNIAAQNVGGSELNSAQNTANAIAGFNAPQVGANDYTANQGQAILNPTYTGANLATTGPASMAQAASLDPNAVQQIQAPTVGADQINNFLNPYTSAVLDTTNKALLQQEQINENTNNSTAIARGAFGGSGSAVQNALTNLNYQNVLGSTDAGINQAGYAQALAAAQQQAAQQLTALQSNQQTALNAGATNAGYQQNANLSNQSALNQFLQANAAAANQSNQFNAQNQLQNQQFNAGNQNTFGLANLNAVNQAKQFSAQQALAAQQSNQAAAVQAAGLKLTAGQQQAAVSAQQLSQALGIQTAVAGVGTQQQAQQQAIDNANLLAYQQNLANQQALQQTSNQAAGLLGNPVLTQSKGSGQSFGANIGLPAPT